MPTKLGNGGKGPEAYNPQDGRYTDEGNISKNERYEGYLRKKEHELDWRNIAYPVDSEQSKKIIQDFYNSGYETEDGSPTVVDIYGEFVYLNKREPESLDELIDFVKEEVIGFMEYGLSNGYDFNTVSKKSPYLVKRRAQGPGIPPNNPNEQKKAMEIMNTGEKRTIADKFNDYYEEYDWAYDELQNLIDRNDFGYPEFEELEEEERDEILQEAFVKYLDEGNDFNSLMKEYEVLEPMCDYITEIMYKRGY